MTAPFPFKHKPYEHQFEVWDRSKDLEYYGLLMDMGTGKSKVVIDTAVYLFMEGKISGFVIVAPKGPITDWTDSHLPEHMPTSIKYEVVEWHSAPGKGLLQKLRDITKPEPGVLKVLIMNTEALAFPLSFKVIETFLKRHRSLFAIDESTYIGNPAAARTKAAMKLRDLATYRRILTGDATPNSPLTVFSQTEFLKKQALGYGSYWAFKADFTNTIPMQFGGARVNQIVGYKNLDLLKEKLSTFSFIVKKEDCLDLPPKIYQTRHVEMGAKQRKAYAQMKDEAIVLIEKALDANSHSACSDDDFMEGVADGLCETRASKPLQCLRCDAVYDNALLCPFCGSCDAVDAPVGLNPKKVSTASLVITQMLRLHQIETGFLVNDAGEEMDFEESNPRLDALLDLCEEQSRGAIVWACYRRNIAKITEALGKKFGPETVVSYFGDTTIDERRSAKRDFQSKDSPVRFFIANPATGKWGLTLTATSTAIYYSQNFDNENRRQSEDRCHRIGQMFPVNYVDMLVKGGISEKILKALKTKTNLSTIINASNWRRLID